MENSKNDRINLRKKITYIGNENAWISALICSREVDKFVGFRLTCSIATNIDLGTCRIEFCAT